MLDLEYSNLFILAGMTPLLHKEITIKEMATRSGLSEHTLRYYERVGLIPLVGRDALTGRRRYSQETADDIEVLACLRASGLGIKEMRDYLVRQEAGGVAISRKELFLKRQQDLQAEIAILKLKYEYARLKVAYHTALEQSDNDEAARTLAQAKAIAARIQQGTGVSL